jgi:hypothetical protein
MPPVTTRARLARQRTERGQLARRDGQVRLLSIAANRRGSITERRLDYVSSFVQLHVRRACVVSTAARAANSGQHVRGPRRPCLQVLVRVQPSVELFMTRPSRGRDADVLRLSLYGRRLPSGGAITRAAAALCAGARDVRLRGSLALHFPPSTQREPTPAIYIARASARPRLQIECGRVRILGGVPRPCPLRATWAAVWQQSRWVMPNFTARPFSVVACFGSRHFGV